MHQPLSIFLFTKRKIFLAGMLFLVCAGIQTTCFAQTEDKKKIEEQLLAKARQNIETYRKGTVSVSFTDAQGKPVKNVSVAVNQQTQDFLFGNLCEEIWSNELTPAEVKTFQERFLALYNFTELALVKWGRYEKEHSKTQWQRLEEELRWCKQNHITPKGHTLGWTNMSGTPAWLLKLPHTMATDLYKAHLQNMVGAYKTQIRMWDVVNEPVTTIPWEKALEDSVFGPSRIDAGTRYNVKGITLQQTAPWVENSYKWAYEVDPKGDFILNEFYLIAKPEIREKFYALVKLLQQKRAPITGIGIQAHEPREMWFSPLEIIATFDRLSELGMPLHITEFIPQSSGKTITGGWRQGVWTEEAQAEFAEQFYTLAFGYPNMASIHWWGLTDKTIWLQGGGLLDSALNPKPVYNRLLKLIKGDWMTKNLSLKTDKNGQATFRGFYGNYAIDGVQKDGSRKNFMIHLAEKAENKWTLVLE